MDTDTEKKLQTEEERNEKQERELRNLFEDFKGHVIDISEHADQVHRVDFSAKLKNGTAFSFNFNSDQWMRKVSPETKRASSRYAPAAPFNAVVDIVGALIAIALMIIVAINIDKLPTFGVTGVLSVFIFTLYICYFILAAIFHLFPEESQVRSVFQHLTSAFKIITLLLGNMLGAILLDGIPYSFVLIFVSILVAALALFTLSFGTKGGGRASLFFSTGLPFLLFIIYPNIPGQYATTLLPFLIPETIMLGLWSFLPLILPSKISGKVSRGRTNNIFPIMGMGCLFFLLDTILKLGL
jgi:predicted membrane channel-forming protein YqfA (hemolysin III family)